jgi:hypothetical protein
LLETIAAILLIAPAVFGLTVTALCVLVFAFRRHGEAAPAPAADPKIESPAWAASGQSRSSALAPSLVYATSASSRSSLAG